MNIFPTDTSTSIPVVKIYTDGSDAHNQINKDFYDNAQIWRNNYINETLDNPKNPIIVWPDKLYIDESILPTIYYLYIYSNRIIVKNWNNRSEVLMIHPDGSVSYNDNFILFRYIGDGYTVTYDTYTYDPYVNNTESYTVTVSEDDVKLFVDTWHDGYISCRIDNISSISDGYRLYLTYINNSNVEIPYIFRVNPGDITEITPVFTTTPTIPTPTTPTPTTTVAPTNTTTNH